jgi:predicted esterase YcpF (UPF0227 family)
MQACGRVGFVPHESLRKCIILRQNGDEVLNWREITAQTQVFFAIQSGTG